MIEQLPIDGESAKKGVALMDSETDEPRKGQTVRVAIGSGVAIFPIASTFWAGATYNRVDSMAQSLTELRLTVARAIDGQSELPLLKQQDADHERRIEYLEEYLRKHP